MTKAAPKTELIEQGLSLLAEQMLTEITELDEKLTAQRAEAEDYKSASAQIEADRKELIRFNAEIEAREKAAAAQKAKNEKDIRDIDKIQRHNRQRATELDQREIDNKRVTLELQEIQTQQNARAKLLASGEKKLEDRKAKLKDIEQARQP